MAACGRIVAALGDLLRRTRGIGMGDFPRPSARVTFRHWESAWMWLRTTLIVVERRTRRRQQLMIHPLEVLADDVQARPRGSR